MPLPVTRRFVALGERGTSPDAAKCEDRAIL
jgi:hypothetical protein